MMEYEIKVTSVTTVYVEAENSRDAIAQACKDALSVSPDSCDAVIVNAYCFDDVIDDGKNIKMANLTGCGIDDEWTLDDCEAKCPRYHSCYAVSLANDVLKGYEMAGVKS